MPYVLTDENQRLAMCNLCRIESWLKAESNHFFYFLMRPSGAHNPIHWRKSDFYLYYYLEAEPRDLISKALYINLPFRCPNIIKSDRSICESSSELAPMHLRSRLQIHTHNRKTHQAQSDQSRTCLHIDKRRLEILYFGTYLPI